MENENLIVKEVSNNVIEKIVASDKNRIVIEGAKGNGKTTTLKYFATSYAKGNNIIIYIDYSNFIYRSELSNSEYNYYYELVFAQKILEFIKSNYYEYYSNFIMYEKFIHNELERFNDYLNTRYYSKNIIKNVLSNDFISKIVSMFKTIIPNFSINLIIDGFDLVGDSSKRYQEFMKNYFHLFDKVIITSSDNNLKKQTFQNELINKNYQIITIDYSKNISNIKKILLNYFNWWFANEFLDINKVKKAKRIISIINNNSFCLNLINVTNGNIDMMISIIRIYYMSDENIEAIISKVQGVYEKVEQNSPVKRLYL